ncbi:MAG: ESPR-type extended signal peptide-containing protein, partial [Stenotrophomonas sp.]
MFNRTTGLMQVASELASTHASPAQSTAAVHRRAPLCAAMTVALGLSAASLPSVSAQVYPYTVDET